MSEKFYAERGVGDLYLEMRRGCIVRLIRENSARRFRDFCEGSYAVMLTGPAAHYVGTIIRQISSGAYLVSYEYAGQTVEREFHVRDLADQSEYAEACNMAEIQFPFNSTN